MEYLDENEVVSFTEVKIRAMQLRPAQRVRLVYALIQSLDQNEAPPVRSKESDRRAEELKSGRVKGIPADEVIANARRRIRR